MNRVKKILRNFILIFALLLIVMKLTDMHFTPIAAYREEEKRKHYGPSEVMQVQKLGEERFVIAKYDKWFSAQDYWPGWRFLWIGSPKTSIIENNKKKAICSRFESGINSGYYIVYGVVNDKKIKRVEVTLQTGKNFSQTKFKDGLFSLSWKDENWEDSEPVDKIIRGYDGDNKIIFEDKVQGVGMFEGEFAG